MSNALVGHAVRHVVRRGVETFSPNAQTMAKLQNDAELYENSDPSNEIRPQEMLPVLITGIIVLFLIASIRYTLGDVVAALSMVESKTTTAIIESSDKLPAYADEPDAPLEKEQLLPSEAQADVEVLLVNNVPITAKITTSIGHLQRVGGFFARWRGLGVSIAYHALHNLASNVLSHVLGFGIVGHAFIYVFTSVALSRFHMVWTHTMIAGPTNKRFWNRMVPRKQCKALLLPSLVLALAQQATLFVPMAVLFSLGKITGPDGDLSTQCAVVGSRVLAVVASAFLTAFCLLLPATVTLTRIEAALLPEGEETIVPFDRQALMGNVDLSVRGGCRALFVQAWRSFDNAARWRLVKLYIKMVLIQLTVVIVGAHIMVAEIYVIGGERLAIFVKSASAQLQLAAIEAHQHSN